jgi:assimilatory nitrate reductase catalytic subunit
VAAIRTTCAYCGVGCGVSATVTGPREVAIKGDVEHPANHGRLCSKGTHLGETVSLDGRLLHPMIGDQRASWDDALDLVSARMKECIAEHGPDSVAFYVSGQLLTEDYYAANKLMKGFVGSGNIDTNSRLCMASAVAAHTQWAGAKWAGWPTRSPATSASATESAPRSPRSGTRRACAPGPVSRQWKCSGRSTMAASASCG